MASPETVLSNIKQTIATTFKGYQTLDWNVIASTRTDDFVYQFLPQALGAPSQDKEAYKATFFNVLKPGFTKFDTQAISTSYDVEQRKATVYGKVEVDGLIGPGSCEFVMLMSFNEDGSKLTRVDEFLDSEFYKDYFPRVGAALKAKAEGS